jgi:hypothetical protein
MALKMSQQQMAGSKQVASPVRVGVARRPVALTVRAETAATAAAAPAKVQTEKTGPNFKPLRDINAIMKTLPHRYVAYRDENAWVADYKVGAVELAWMAVAVLIGSTQSLKL